MKKVVTFGEIMLRLSPPGHLRFSQASSFEAIYGGGESNVASSLANFGVPAEFVTRLPDNDLGRCAEGELRKRGVKTDNIAWGGQRLGIYFLETGAVARGSKVVYDRAHSAISTIQKGMIDWEQVFDGVGWFHWTGITPAISQGAADATLEAIQAANDLGITVSTDLNYRAKLWNYGKKPGEVMPELVEGCDIILGNEEDAEKHFGIHPADVDVTKGGTVESEAYRVTCEQLYDRFDRSQKIITTLRGSISASHNTWSGVLYNGEEFLTTDTYDITHIVRPRRRGRLLYGRAGVRAAEL
ncbi:MAG: sugar kinase [Balneolaceae bacterium]|nr:sugar kinase [Balneolaceae bacterium]